MCTLSFFSMSVNQGSEKHSEGVLPATAMLAYSGLFLASLSFHFCSSSHWPCCSHPELKDVLYCRNFPYQLKDCLILSRLKPEKWKPKVGAQSVQGQVCGTGSSWGFQTKHLHFILRPKSTHVHQAHMEHLSLIAEVHIIEYIWASKHLCLPSWCCCQART